MGASTSALYLQNTKHNKVINVLKQCRILGYYRYMDDNTDNIQSVSQLACHKLGVCVWFGR
jgi:hypothetical protein